MIFTDFANISFFPYKKFKMVLNLLMPMQTELHMKESHILHSYADRLPLDVMIMRGTGTPKAILQIVHGMCGYKEKFIRFMEYMTANGILCVAYDQRGHGNSVWKHEDLGHMYDQPYQTLVSEIAQVQDYTRRTYADYSVPYFILGHSMGSLAVRTYLKTYDSHVEGAFLCGTPAFNPLAPAFYAFTGLMCRLGMGRTRATLVHKTVGSSFNRKFEDEGPLAWLTSDEVFLAEYLSSPSSRSLFSMNAANVLMGLMRESYGTKGWAVSNPFMPVVFLSGDDDACLGDASALDMSVSLMSKVGYHDVRKKIYTSMRHDILNEIGKEKVWHDILDVICRP